jgi:hypothetical protein
MGADATAIRYGCPLCEETFRDETSVRQHITNEKDENHRGWDGYKLDRQVPVIEDPDLMPLDKKIRKAAQKFDELTSDEAHKVAEAAGASKHRVCKEWADAGFDTDFHHKTSYNWEDLTDRQQNVMSTFDKLDTESLTEVGNELGIHRSNVQEVYNKYGYLLENRYKPDGLGEAEHSSDNDSPKDTDNNGVKPIKALGEEVQKLDDAGVDFTVSVSVTDEKFNAIRKLIEAGYDDLAEEYFER